MAITTAKAALYGSPASGMNDADRALMLTYLQQLETNAASNGAMWPYDSKSGLVASAGVDGDTGLVLNDGTASNNGLYVRTSGTWTKTAALPPLWESPKTLTGAAGSGTAYTASGSVGSDIDGGWVLFTPQVANTSGTPTLSINGGTARAIGRKSGALGAGRFVAGVPVIMYRDGTVWRTTNSLDSNVVNLGTLTTTNGLAYVGTAKASFAFQSIGLVPVIAMLRLTAVWRPSSLTIRGKRLRQE